MSKLRVGAQLYTVRDQLADDFAGTLKKIARIGYEYVELSGHFSHSAEEIRAMLDEAGLAACSDHSSIDDLEKDINRAIDETKTVGADILICPWLPEDRRSDESSWRKCAEILNKAGQACRKVGITLCYHNHSFEFVRFGDKYAFDVLFDETDSACVQACLDVYWLAHGGQEPVDYIKRFAGRCPVVHLKDMADDADRSYAEVGEGILDFEAIIAACESAGIVWGMVEQDVCAGDPVDSLAKSWGNLQKMGYV